MKTSAPVKLASFALSQEACNLALESRAFYRTPPQVAVKPSADRTLHEDGVTKVAAWPCALSFVIARIAASRSGSGPTRTR